MTTCLFAEVATLFSFSFRDTYRHRIDAKDQLVGAGIVFSVGFIKVRLRRSVCQLVASLTIRNDKHFYAMNFISHSSSV